MCEIKFHIHSHALYNSVEIIIMLAGCQKDEINGVDYIILYDFPNH